MCVRARRPPPGSCHATPAHPCSARQHVPLPEYKANLAAIVEHLRGVGVPAIVLITPPPISEPDRIIHVQKVRWWWCWVCGTGDPACMRRPALGVPRLHVWKEALLGMLQEVSCSSSGGATPAGASEHN